MSGLKFSDTGLWYWIRLDWIQKGLLGLGRGVRSTELEIWLGENLPRRKWSLGCGSKTWKTPLSQSQRETESFISLMERLPHHGSSPGNWHTEYVLAYSPWEAIKHTFWHMDIKKVKDYPIAAMSERGGEPPSWLSNPSRAAGWILPFLWQDANW